MSDTPETDAQQLVHSVTGATLRCVDVEFARKLERERDEWYEKCHANAVLVMDAREERDEANEELHKRLTQYDTLFDEADKIKKERDQWCECAEQLKRDKDEALAMVKRLLYTAHLGPESQERYNVLDEAQNFLKDKKL